MGNKLYELYGPNLEKLAPVYRALYEKRQMTVGTAATINGCCGLFDLCADKDLMSLSMMGQEPFLDWIGWEKSDVCEIRKDFITWIRADASQGVPTAGYVADPCGDSHGAEWGECDFLLEGFGRLRRHTPVRDVTKVGLRLCDNQPRYALDGRAITDDLEFDVRITTEAIMQDLRRLVVIANHTIGTDDGLFDGLQQLINFGYVNTHGRRCCMMDSIVVDWNANTLCDKLTGAHGATWNGVAIPAGFDFIEVLMAAYRRIRRRLSMAPALSGNLTTGDMVLVMPTNWAQCLLDCYTCWSLCVGSFTETRESRLFRDSLNGGMFGGGEIKLDGFTIPIIPYEWSMINGVTRADAYLLTGKVGSQKLIQGQYNDLSKAVGNMIAADYTDGGRLLTWINQDQTCVQREVEMQPRLLAWAPWAQARFIDLRCATPGGALSPDPWDTSFYPECSFSVAECPDRYPAR